MLEERRDMSLRRRVTEVTVRVVVARIVLRRSEENGGMFVVWSVVGTVVVRGVVIVEGPGDQDQGQRGVKERR